MTDLAALTTDEVAALLSRGDGIALLPVGSTEAHGPHLPLATDVMIAQGVATRAAHSLGRSGRVALVLPPIAYAVTEFVGDFRGTISVRAAVAGELVADVCRGAIRSGFSRVVLVNGHLEPEHGKMLKDVATRLRETEALDVHFPDQRRPPTVALLGTEFGQGGGHAGGYETALVMAIRPDLVREDVRRALEDKPIDLAARLKAGARTAREIGGDRAYFGFPASASLAEGERLLGVLAAMVAEAALAP